MYPYLKENSYLYYFDNDGFLFTDKGKCILNDIEIYMIEKFNGNKSVDEITNEIALEIDSRDKTRIKETLMKFIDSKREVIFLSESTKWQPLSVKGIKGQRAPLDLTISLTNKCNLQCIHCFKCCSIDERDFISTQRLMKALSFLKGKLFSIQLTGGEPMLHKDFDPIIRFCIENFATTITTNATLLNSANISIFKGINAFQTSLYSHIPDEHDYITKVKGSHYKTVNGIKEVVKSGIHCQTASIVTPGNIKNIEDVIKFNSELGVNVVRFGYLVFQGRGLDLRDTWMLSDEYINKVKLILKELKEKYKDKIEVQSWEDEKNEKSVPSRYRGFRCGGGVFKWAISERGIVKPCEFIPDEIGAIGNINESNVKDIIRNNTLEELPGNFFNWKKELDEKGCSLRNICEEVENYYNDYCKRVI